MARFERYKILKDSDDLDRSVLRFTEAMSLPLPWDKRCRSIFEIFFALTLALVHRAEDSRQAEDVTRSIIHLRYLRAQSLEAFNISPNRVTGLLVDALGIQSEMRLGDARQDIEEMVVLCHELLKSDIPTTSLSGFIMGLVQAVAAQFVRFNERHEPSDKVIECLREANRRLPDSHDVSTVLALSLFGRFLITYSNDDYEEGTIILNKVIHAPGNGPTPHKEAALRLVTTFSQARSFMFGKPEHLEQAIHSMRTLLDEAPPEGTLHFSVAYGLALFQGSRFGDSVGRSGLQEAEAHIQSSGGISFHPSFRDLTPSLAELNADSHDKHLDAILSIDRIFEKEEVEEAIKYCRALLASSQPDSLLGHLAGSGLGLLLLRAFDCTNKIEYITEAISVFRGLFNTRGSDFATVKGLITSLCTRLNLLPLREDFNEIMQLFPIAVNDERAETPSRFLASCNWANWARMSGHPCTLTAYDCAISLLQDTLTFAPTLDIQHSRLVAMRYRFENLPLDYASYHISTGQLHRAVETLERGRGLIWSEMRGLRTSIDQIRAADTHLADKFEAVNRDLEILTLKITPNSKGDSREDGVRMDPLGHLIVQQRKLLDERNKLISQIQALPRLETFLKSPSFDKLRAAAARGPVVIINHCKWRSDILIILHNTPLSHIPMAEDFYDRANDLRDLLLGALARKEGPDSNQYENILKSVLKGLYELVGKPVIQRLDELNVPKQSRVWWCPTSAFCSLPLHAMGPIPSDDVGPPQYFLDQYIPSFTPTLSALIESNKSGPHISDKPSILLVSQPDASLPGAFGEIQVVGTASTQVTILISAKATPTTVLERLQDHRFVHIVCHGILEAGKPFDASFKLYRDERLSLLDIVRSRLPEAEFAFLSACHTAQLTDESIADEALHLAAAMQYCGFRSVVGTMWAMADKDGRDLAGNFYKQVFSDRKQWQGVPYYERTAKALRNAVKKLRKESRTLERWVNFVHYGA